MEENNIMLLHKGNLTAELLTSLLQATEGELEKFNETPKIRKRVFNVIVECFQNVYLHLDREYMGNSKEDAALLIVWKSGSDYVIITGNKILHEKADQLKKTLDHLTALSQDELKEKYNEVLAMEGYSEKGGASLGLIDIMRKSESNIDYSFKRLNDKFAFFSLQVAISS